MKVMDELGLMICRYQGKLFRASIDGESCSSPIFIRRFAYSDLAKRMDYGGFMFTAEDINNALDDIKDQYGESSYGKTKYGKEEMYWIGYIYRYWVYTYERSTEWVYTQVKPGELRDLYFPYHSLDPAQAIERIIEAKGIESVDDIAHGVRVMRKVREKMEKNY